MSKGLVLAGIDPGVTGGIAFLGGQGEVLLVEDLPVHMLAHGKQRRAELDLATLRQLFLRYPVDHVYIERVASRPGQGTVSMFRFGLVYGAITGLVTGLPLPYSLVVPQTWQRMTGCGSGPEAARQRATQLFPEAADRLTRKKDGGRAAALLIARAGLRLLQASQPMAAE
jgi:crossover junction endodeoxyribonuclease RuvC